jgi:hypothetical protein
MTANDGEELSGAAERIRTSDPRITNALLYRLSYRGDSLIAKDNFSDRTLVAAISLPDCYPFPPARCFSNACRKVSSTRLAASACIPGRTCE